MTPDCKEASGCGEADRGAGGCDAVCGSLMKVFPECHMAAKNQLLFCPWGGRGLLRQGLVRWVHVRIRKEKGRENKYGVAMRSAGKVREVNCGHTLQGSCLPISS